MTTSCVVGIAKEMPLLVLLIIFELSINLLLLQGLPCLAGFLLEEPPHRLALSFLCFMLPIFSRDATTQPS